jgi:hypothetical protein
VWRRRWLVLSVAAAAGFAGALAVALAYDRDDGPVGSPVAAVRSEEDPGPVHVHGLGVNPADRSLFIATHTGMWELTPGEREPARVGTSRQDTMGFTVTGRGRFLGSGHPDVREARARGLPPLLGLIESRDLGRTWRPVSLLGEADFHVLRSAGDRVYGYDASNDRLLASGDGGRTWQERQRPAPIFDLAAAPDEPARLLATTTEGLFESTDGGDSWRRKSDAVGLLGWPAARRLFLVAGSGQLVVSRDGGRSWGERGSIGGVPAAFLARSPAELYVALHDGAIRRSDDGGWSWTTLSGP